MGKKTIIAVTALALLGLGGGAYLELGGKAPAGAGEAAAEGEGSGPRGGMLLRQGDLTLELLVPEDGSPLKAWVERGGKALAPQEVVLGADVEPATGEVEDLLFKASGDGLVANAGIAEPHAFTARLKLMAGKQGYDFAFTREEGKLELDAEQIEAAGITLDTARTISLAQVVSLPGEIRFNEDRTAHIVPRLPGIVDSVPANLGQAVKQGELLAVISSPQLSDQRSEFAAAQRRLSLAQSTYKREQQLWKEGISAEQEFLLARQGLQEAEIALNNARAKIAALGGNPSLQGGNRYELRAPFAGVLVEKHLTQGEPVDGTANVFTLSDLSSVWATFNVPAQLLGQVRVGSKVKVLAQALDSEVEGTVSYIGDLLGEQTRAATARVTLSNPESTWRPGLFVSVQVAEATRKEVLTVADGAVQNVDGEDVVFVRVADGFVVQPVKLGISDGQRVEVLEGLRAGSQVAASGSFILKSELGKGSAEHGH
ncbi:efflux RND transporter periplasmic adaptor subunit [Pseudomonas aeruginosa]|uniref:efflux RND transporter periplasmic adaptor subunit n=1 Tax=Pseudomonas aeruginosa TaxID=287 RepID=UPI00247AC200|nr:efflux RND transporter periplasmic adaptor subunit [Pseudomonas aeruginosa]